MTILPFPNTQHRDFPAANGGVVGAPQEGSGLVRGGRKAVIYGPVKSSIHRYLFTGISLACALIGVPFIAAGLLMLGIGSAICWASAEIWKAGE